MKNIRRVIKYYLLMLILIIFTTGCSEDYLNS